jgi:hypothetical protein
LLILGFLPITSFSQDAYVLSYFGGSDGQEALYMAYSHDALHWTAINKTRPVLKATLGKKSIRDPYIYRKPDGKFVLMSTDSWFSEYLIFWDSDDLITFKNERWIRMNTINQHAWAPECIYDPVLKQSIVYWSGNVIYANTTTDFKTFSSAKKFFDPGHICIDADIVFHNGTNYLFYKDERGANEDNPQLYKALKVATSKTLDFNSLQSGSTEYITEHEVEGPACIKDLTKDRWYLYYDYYFKGGIWGCSYTDDLSSGIWTKMADTEFSLPKGVRHGNAVKVTEAELKKMLDANDENITHP